MKKKQGFESGLKRLEEIAAILDTGDADLEDAVNLYEEGIKLSAELQGFLNKVERRITLAGSEKSMQDLNTAAQTDEDTPTLF